MGDIQEKRKQRIERFFGVVRYAMGIEAGEVPQLKANGWERLFSFADEQAIAGVVWQGIRQIIRLRQNNILKDNNVSDDTVLDDLKLEWGYVAQQIEDQNRRLNRKCVEVQRELQEAGFACCILKGQGNALMYPHLLLRTPGDIDVLVKLTADSGQWTISQRRKEIVRWVKERKDMMDIRFHHVEYEEDGIGLELHFIPCSMNNPVYNRRLQRWFAEMAGQEDIWHHEVELPDTDGADLKISIPTVGFNVVYQLAHMMHHFFDEGIGLRQMMDYYYVLKSNTNRTDDTNIRDTLRYLGLWKFAGAVMYVMREVFHLEEKYMIAPVDEKRGETLMEEILKGGNFGHYSGLTDHSTAGKYFAKHWRNLHFVREYPSEALCEPFFRTWHFFWRIMYR